MAKSADAFRTISEVADWLETPAHVLRFWESKFSQVKPVKRAGGRRYYRPADMKLLGGIKKLLHDDGMTIKGVQKVLREQGVKHVAELSQPLGDAADDVIIEATVETEKAEVMTFQRRPAEPERAKIAPTATEEDQSDDAATEPEAEPEPSLPSFLHRREESGPERPAPETEKEEPSPEGAVEEPAAEAEPPAPQKPAPAKVDVPDDPPDTIAAEAGALSRLVGLSRPISTQTAERLAPLLAKLRASAGTPRAD